VTAHDFAFSWRRFLTPSHGAEYAYLLHGVRHAEALHLSRARAERLRKETLPAFVARAGTPWTAEAWRGFVAGQDLVAALADLEDPVVRRVLTSREGPRPDERAAFRAALEAEAARHDARAAAACHRHLSTLRTPRHHAGR
jgi:hypothetical protein